MLVNLEVKIVNTNYFQKKNNNNIAKDVVKKLVKHKTTTFKGENTKIQYCPLNCYQ